MPRPAFKGEHRLIFSDRAEVEASRPDFDDGYKPHYTKTPQPDWKPGGGLNTLVSRKGSRILCMKRMFDARQASSDKFRDQSQWRSIDPKEHAQPSLYKVSRHRGLKLTHQLMISAIVSKHSDVGLMLGPSADCLPFKYGCPRCMQCENACPALPYT